VQFLKTFFSFDFTPRRKAERESQARIVAELAENARDAQWPYPLDEFDLMTTDEFTRLGESRTLTIL
jgi:hypothetical protein